MKKASLLLSFFCLTVVLSNCRNQVKPIEPISETEVSTVNPYLKKHSGGYTIEVEGISNENSIEAYALSENGQAKWMWIKNNGKGDAKIESQKTGRWTATENQISITINGNTGQIVENYVILNGVFVNTLNSERFLKPN